MAVIIIDSTFVTCFNILTENYNIWYMFDDYNIIVGGPNRALDICLIILI